MRIAVIGCGAIGGLFLGYLADQGLDVIGIVRQHQKQPLNDQGLLIEGVGGSKKYKVCVDTKLKERVDLAIFATKISDIEGAVQDNLEHLKDAIILSTQNGVEADYILNKYFPSESIITGIVMFGATYYPPNKVMHNFEGELILGNIFGDNVKDFDKVKEFLGKGFKISETSNIKGAKYLKVFINLNNCIPAALGISMQEAFADLELAELSIRLNKEAYQVVTKSGITLESLPTYPKERLQGLVSMDVEEATKLFSKIMTSLSKEPIYGSILQSIKRKKKSEIDYINGEIVSLAKKNNLEAPLNEKIVELIHSVEQSNKFFSKKEVLSQIASIQTA